jgi:AAA+ ATPase superfamily predicted ATPase
LSSTPHSCTSNGNQAFSILQLIAANKTAQSEIDSVLGKTSTSYLANLEARYSLVKRVKPMFSKPGSRNIRWRIRDTYLSFWFRFIYANQTLVEQQRPDLLLELLYQDYSAYSGMVLEDYFREKIMEEERFTAIGSYWDRRSQNEIDLIALSVLDKKALIAEIKRSEKNIDLAILKSKASTLKGELADYEVTFKGLSLGDM